MLTPVFPRGINRAGAKGGVMKFLARVELNTGQPSVGRKIDAVAAEEQFLGLLFSVIDWQM
jgi:hypothetical protein